MGVIVAECICEPYVFSHGNTVTFILGPYSLSTICNEECYGDLHLVPMECMGPSRAGVIHMQHLMSIVICTHALV